MTGEIVYGMSFEDYKKAPGINGSLLKIVDKSSMVHVKAAMDGKVDSTDEQDFGKAFHALLLENRQDFVIHPDAYPGKKKEDGTDPNWNWNANFCKEWAKGQELPILSHAEGDDLLGMVQSLRSNDRFSAHLNDSKCEVSLFAEMGGVKVKARIDILPSHGPVIDPKSTGNAEPVKFMRLAYDLDYFMKAAFYLDVLNLCGDKREEFWLVAIEREYPYAHSILAFKDVPISFIEMGRIRYRNALAKLTNAIKTNKWPSYGVTEAELVASPWMLKELELSP